MSTDLQIRQAVYRLVVAAGRAPDVNEVAVATGVTVPEVREAYARLTERHLLVVEPGHGRLLMAPPFSAVPTQHRVRVAGIEYFAPCAWDAFGIVALLGGRGEVRSRCEQSGEPLELRIESDVPAGSGWLFHSLVPARRWWNDIVFT
jgi:DNA-binding transcriptional MocR family regulator